MNVGQGVGPKGCVEDAIIVDSSDWLRGQG